MKTLALFLVLGSLAAGAQNKPPLSLPPDSSFTDHLSVSFIIACTQIQSAVGGFEKELQQSQSVRNALLASLDDAGLEKLSHQASLCFLQDTYYVPDLPPDLRGSHQQGLIIFGSLMADIETERRNRLIDQYNALVGKYNSLQSNYAEVLTAAKSLTALPPARQPSNTDALTQYLLLRELFAKPAVVSPPPVQLLTMPLAPATVHCTSLEFGNRVETSCQ